MTEDEFKARHTKIFYSKRWENRLTQGGVARLAGVSPELISKIERGESYPSFSTLFKIAQVFKMKTSAYIAYVESGEILATKASKRERRSNYR